MSEFQLLALLSTMIASGQERTPTGAISSARELLETMEREEAELFRGHQRAQMTESLRAAAAGNHRHCGS